MQGVTVTGVSPKATNTAAGGGAGAGGSPTTTAKPNNAAGRAVAGTFLGGDMVVSFTFAFAWIAGLGVLLL